MLNKSLIIFFLSFSHIFNGMLLAGDTQSYFITGNGIRVRSSIDENTRVLGVLNLNDEVKVLNFLPPPNDNYVEVEIIKTESIIFSSQKYFIAKEFLLEKPVDYKIFKGKYFIVLNVASETLRLYERNCMALECFNKMIMETEVVVGEDKNLPKNAKGKGRSILGSFRVRSWTKFYEDGEGHYPAWYKEGYPEVPKVNNHSIGSWFSKQYMPEEIDGTKNGKTRGAFGWYTMFLAPEPFGQWVHGTIGWGEDKEYYIKKIKTVLPNIFFDPRSSGCTRNNNEAIAYLRQMVDVGTPVIKIYAEEKKFDPYLSNYPEASKPWQYVLTKMKGTKADREETLRNLDLSSEELDRYWEIKRRGDRIILDPRNPLNQIIEVGTYEIDTHPDAMIFTPGEKMSKFGRKIYRNGNVYGIKSSKMFGFYYVDTGILYNYKHPSEVLDVSGFLDEVIPPWMMTK